MHAFAIFAVNEHIAELQAEAARERLLRSRNAVRAGRVALALARLSAAFRAPEASPTTTLAFFSSVK
ncbi:MAG TPA: hypothetical protein VFK54_00995 [Candidatus Limnocylindrales bacterium]|nr:hypothetical protein [Candidatus Limnocylindrales bacterium]